MTDTPRKDAPPPGFSRAFKKAKKISEDARKTAKLINEAKSKIQGRKSRVLRMREDLENLFRLLTAWSKGQYKRVPLKTILLAISALVYFVNPFDMVHDYIPGAGYIDDATILAFVVNSIRTDIQEFLSWEKHS